MKNTFKLLLMTGLLFTMSACQTTNSQNNNSGQDPTPSDPGGGTDPEPPGPQPEKNSEWDEEAQTVSISTLLNKGKTTDTTHLYRITGVVQYISSTKYGNFDIIDSTGSIYVYGCSSTSNCITKSGSKFTFTNKSNFSSAGVKQSDTVELIGMYTWYALSDSYGYGEFQGFVRKINQKGNYKLEGQNYTTAESYSGSYYNSITATGGNNLADQLHDLMASTHTSWTTYSGLYSAYSHTGEKSSGQYKCFYSGNYYSNVNREHVWPQSMSENLWGEEHGGADLLHVRPANATYNSQRSNSPFGEIVGDNVKPKTISYNGGGQCRYATKVFEPADAIKGDVARIIMYVYLHYSTDYGTTQKSWYADLNLGKVLAPYYDSECFKLLRKWNAMDPVSAQEKTMNDYAQTAQGNRNPFIDHPTYADKIWG